MNERAGAGAGAAEIFLHSALPPPSPAYSSSVEHSADSCFQLNLAKTAALTHTRAYYSHSSHITLGRSVGLRSPYNFTRGGIGFGNGAGSGSAGVGVGLSPRFSFPAPSFFSFFLSSYI